MRSISLLLLPRYLSALLLYARVAESRDLDARVKVNPPRPMHLYASTKQIKPSLKYARTSD
eukprot:7919237-Heterocapsa_arctica.AAC.1